MKLTVLTDNHAGGKFLAEHGISYLVEYDNHTLLFDTGHSNAFLKNAELLHINLNDFVNTIVLSHGHWDHGDGLRFISNKTLVTHPLSFIKRFRKKDNTPIGLTLNKEEIEQRFDLKTSVKPYLVSDKIIFLGEIPRVNDFECKHTPYVDEDGNPDFVTDDSAVVLIDKDEIVIVTGCSHSGICNIIDYAKKIFKRKRIKAVIGGFHLKDDGIKTQLTIQHLRKNDIQNIYPAHCTELPALAAFYSEFKIQQVKTGMIINF
ncbi:MBL fold metallo-hydrolase [Abyssalbus ytuae]|uniref:MBL fold metallo-hydrolase n=1 Tax=Abyssalbus ytuae TaxID=2926907 RepID=A0A9E7D3I2_9FLAO|nr:MBL fold metallo-hydrolase [Abyssalbus ytuae]UOB19343.1 MBL fold metallo-hydrolase [Abyssalbus ytuae]